MSAVTRAIERRRRALAAEWNELGAVVLIGAGDPIPIPGRADRVYPFLAHSEYFYLTDRQRPGAVLAYDPQEGWSEFVPAISADERLWSGALSDEARTPTSELESWLEKRRGRRVAQLGAPIPNAPSDTAVGAELRTRMDRVRRRKDDVELDRMRLAADATRAGFAAAVRFTAPGISERALQIEIEAEFFRHGADTVAYDSIIASGPNAAVLHHLPTQRLLGSGELVLVDAGAEYRGYDCDVTRTYPVSGHFSAEQADVYALVLRVQRAAIERCRAGVEYRDVHLAAALDIAQGLADAGFLRGNAADLVEQGACALFFPHGIGHMVGLGVRDAGGYLPGRSRSEAPALRFLRIDLPLEPGHVVTIEPGIYFPPHVLDDPEIRRHHRDTVVWNRVDTLRGFGGSRIEDDVLILDGGNEVLTRVIPKENVGPMYVPKHFEERDPERLRGFIERYPLGALVTATESGLDANHIPFLFADTGSAAGTLHGHIARANPLWREVVHDATALVIFQGPDSFISPSWYPSKRENARVVPTWNYVVVHVHGVLRCVDDPAWVRSHVEALTREHEGKRDAPWAVTDAPADFIEKLVTAVVGIEISITRLLGKWKVSQNRSISDRVGVVEALEREAAPPGTAIAALMRETLDGGD